MFLPTVRAVSRVGKTHTALRSPSLELRSPQASTIPCFIQDYATDRPTWLTYPHTQYSLSFKEREREKRREEKKVEAMAMAEGMQAGGRAEQKVDIIAGLDLLGKCLRRPREERRGDRGGRAGRWAVDLNIYNAAAAADSLLPGKLKSSVRRVPPQPPTSPSPPSVEIYYKELRTYIRRTREDKKKSIWRRYHVTVMK